jgi:hypothetical protein
MKPIATRGRITSRFLSMMMRDMVRVDGKAVKLFDICPVGT